MPSATELKPMANAVVNPKPPAAKRYRVPDSRAG